MNVAELRASIARAGVTNRKIAAELGLSEQALYNKMQGESEFKSSEIKKMANLLSLSMQDVNLIFFDFDVN